MSSSILRNLLISFLAFGLGVAAVFPFYAHFFVEWKPGMLVWFVLGCLVAGVMIGVANYWLVNTILLRQLRRISEVANAISNKDLSFNCTMRSDDTIGEIITSFNAMSSNLRHLIGETSSTSDSVRIASSDLHGMVRRIKDNVDTQSARAGEIEHAIERLSGTVQEIAESSEKAAERAGQAGEHAEQGRHVVTLTLNGMEKISQTVSEAAQAVESLGTSSQRIGAIVAVIKEIAEQTNLLALNAAIEAARAGEQGRGFAVVADEVRKLAEKTTSATQEISTMISAIQSETAQAVRTMDTGKDEVAQGVSKAREAGEALQRIVDNVGTLNHMVREIAAATHTQRSDVQAVRTNTGEITSLIGDTVQRTESATLKTDALADQAAKLHGSVQQFKLS